MQHNIEIIDRFYNAFSKRDYQTMQECYSDDIIFSDPVFGLLKGEEAKCMWEMLCKRATNLNIEHSNIQLLDDEYATCDWTAHYTFSATGRKVVNKIRAYMRLKDGKIIEHSDAFKLSKWAAQALGWKGVLFGGFGFMQRGIQKKARKSLMNYMEKKNSSNG